MISIIQKIKRQFWRSREVNLLPNKLNLIYEDDPLFNSIYDLAIQKTGTPEIKESFVVYKRRARFYNTMEFFNQTIELEGEVIECGCWKGLSSLMFCNYMKQYNPQFDGSGFHIVDSFEGLSEPSKEDVIAVKEDGTLLYGAKKHVFSYQQDLVIDNLKDFPNISYYKGWIPDILLTLPEMKYKFVHIDVDLYDPIKGACAYFYDRCISGGIMLFDDYGSLAFPGAKKAIDEFCANKQIRPISISTAQAVIIKK